MEDLASGVVTSAASAPTQPENVFETLDKIASRFHLVVCQLRTRHEGRPTLDVSDEYDVQDLLHALLRIYFDDVRPEEWTPSYAGKASRVDFLLKNERAVVETKKSRHGLTAKEIGTQLIDDKTRYKKHAECDHLFCLVYDPDHLVKNPRGFENDLSEASSDFRVRVRVVPQG